MNGMILRLFDLIRNDRQSNGRIAEVNRHPPFRLREYGKIEILVPPYKQPSQAMSESPVFLPRSERSGSGFEPIRELVRRRLLRFGEMTGDARFRELSERIGMDSR